MPGAARHLSHNLMLEPNGRSLWLILEHFTTAKLVTTTSRTPNASRSAAANDVSLHPAEPVAPRHLVPPVSFRLASPSSHGPPVFFLCSRNSYFYDGVLV